MSHGADKAMSRSVDELASQLVGDLSELESSHVKAVNKEFSCPKCAQPLDGTEARCPSCGQVLSGRRGVQCPICKTPVDEWFTECPRCGISLDRVSQEAKPMIPSDLKSKDKSPVKARAGERPDSRICPHCGAIVPRKFQKCPLCSTSFEKAEPRAAVLTPEVEVSKVSPPDELAIARAEVGAEELKPIKERKLRAAKVTSVPVTAQTSARGLTNGVGQVNGLGKVNGTGVVNGKSFVNGTGISNGLGAPSKESSRKRASFLTRWQFLAVLIAIVIIIPAFIFLSYSDEGREFVVDGEFSDWDGAAIYGTKIPSAKTTSNITEWAVATEESDLFLYFRTQAHMMSSPNAESYYLFVDSDGSNATGYVVESLGADYMLQLTGWDSEVNSTSLSEYSSSSDQYNWTAWTSIGPVSYSLDLARLEAGATLPVELGESAKFLLVSKDSEDYGSVSYTAPLKGGLLIVRQAPSSDVVADGIISRLVSAPILRLNFTCEGAGGEVVDVNPSIFGAPLSQQEPAFTLEIGAYHEMTISVDTTSTTDGQPVLAEVIASRIDSSFSCVEVIGPGASAYAGSPPPVITIDGAFADWAGRLSFDQDSGSSISLNVDIDEVGNLSNSQDSYFYVSVQGEMCGGTFVPTVVAKPSGGGGGGGVIPIRRTAEDILNIYVDSDKSSSSGQVISLNTKQIGADQKIEVKGLWGRITSTKEYDYDGTNWVASYEPVKAAKDEKRIEISVDAVSLGGSTDIDFIVETTSWKGRSDLAVFDPSSMRAMTRTWVVDSTTTSAYATSMSYQRKMFYDGVNYWSLYFDGTNTVYKYSEDDGQTWTLGGSVFVTPGVNETSIWYDDSTGTVYAVGDIASPSNNVSIQVGTVDPAAHTISWAASDSNCNTSSFPLAGKNTYICKDLNGYLWVLSSNSTTVLPGAYQLSAFKSSEVNSTTSWVSSGQMLAATQLLDNVKGSIVPAGSGSDVWAVYAYGGRVDARKYNGTWLAPQTVCVVGPSKANTDNSPPSVVVDGKGVVHVVYGTGRKLGPTSTPLIEYSHNNTDLTTFTPGVSLDPLMPADVGGFYPTISLEISTGNLYVLWLESDATSVVNTVTGRKCVSGTWSKITIEPQTSYSKQYLTSIYSVSGEFKICWQWTQNVTSEPKEVLFDGTAIPELSDLALPLVLFVAVFSVYIRRSRGRDKLTE